MVSTDFIYGGFTLYNSGENFEEFPVVFLKVVSLGIFDINFLGLADSSKLGEVIGCK